MNIKTLTNEERKEALQLIIEYTRTKMLLVDERQKQLIKRYIEED